ncbi:MAG: hypothetical protein DRI57_21620 [Deltaproteobacteria bacterium]|nr:MAG: hypothetical protein DRI57_21620 [Deltaproteobacteria bacterium]
MYNILLIRTSELYSGRDEIHGYYVPPIGILYLASVLMPSNEGKYRVSVFDAGLETENFYELETSLITNMKKLQPRIVGLSTISNEANLMHAIAEIIKRFSSEINVVAGGPYPTAFPERVLADKNIDYAVIGEGEQVFPALADAIVSEMPAEDIAGIAYMKDDELKINDSPEYIADLNSLPFPAWDMIDFGRYSASNNMLGMLAEGTYAPIFTSRGCPYKCIYCHNIFGKKTRLRSARNVFEEIKLLTEKHGVKEFHIYDDIFNINKQRVTDICDLIVRNNLDIRIAFPNGLRGDILDKEVIQSLEEAGAYTLTFAVETASERLQKMIKKNVNLKKINEAISLSAEAGLINFGFFMLGFPTETEDEMFETIKFARNSDLHFANFFQVRPFPKTGLYALALQNGYVPTDNFFDYNYHSYGINCSGLPAKDFTDMCLYAYKRFYFHPKRILKMSKKIPLDMLYRNLAKICVIIGWKRILEPYHLRFAKS